MASFKPVAALTDDAASATIDGRGVGENPENDRMTRGNTSSKRESERDRKR